MKQKYIFLEGEGDAWFERNMRILGSRKLPESDPLLMDIIKLPSVDGETRVLEIGCGDGTRLNWLRENLGYRCHGIDPSATAVEVARRRGIDAIVGTADQLPYGDITFDIVIFGFCLYLCDREDLFRIACEADRVLREQGWLLILDFYSPTPLRREYDHHSGVLSYKMDYRTLFTWNPAYTSFSHTVCHLSEHDYTDDRTEWIATSVLRKKLPSDA